MRQVTRTARLASTTLCSALLLVSGPICTAGPLDPPGPPAPTMKTLDQVESRTPITSLPLTISAGGSYYLTRSFTIAVPVTSAIEVNTTAPVTIDLNGFTIDGAGTSTYGINDSGSQTLTVLNGTIRGFTAGIDAVGLYQVLDRVSILDSSLSAATLTNFSLTRSFLLNGAFGIQSSGVALIKESRISGFSSTGIAFRGPRNLVESSIIDFNGTGIFLHWQAYESTLRRCTIVENREGVLVYGWGNKLEGNNISGNSSDGIRIANFGFTCDYNTIEGNSLARNNGFGIWVDCDRNILSGNRAMGNFSGNYVILGVGNIAPIENGTLTNAASNVSN